MLNWLYNILSCTNCICCIVNKCLVCMIFWYRCMLMFGIRIYIIGFSSIQIQFPCENIMLSPIRLPHTAHIRCMSTSQRNNTTIRNFDVRLYTYRPQSSYSSSSSDLSIIHKSCISSFARFSLSVTLCDL